MLTRRRVLTAAIVVVIAALLWSAWLAWRTQRDLQNAQRSVSQLQAALESGNDQARDAAIKDLQTSAASAKDRTDGLWWSGMTLTPFVGDDLRGVRALSESLDVFADQAVTPLADVADDVDSVVANGRVDLDVVSSLSTPVRQAHEALDKASGIVDDEDSSGYFFLLKDRYDEYARTVDDLARGLGSAETAVDLVPSMLGGDGPRDYLLVFQNNAEIRGTGGLGGSWARLHADDGKLDLKEQGSAKDFGVSDPPLGDLTTGETEVFGKELGRYFQDANFTPDYPRAADLYGDFWDKKEPDHPLDGVISIDVVALSELLEGIGPVQADGVTLTSDNAVETLLSTTYENPDPDEQDKFFQDAAKAIFEAATSKLTSPLEFARGLRQASEEGRFLVAPFDESEAGMLAGTRVEGALTGDEGETPHVDVALNDATASKMSYYLRYGIDLESVGCSDGVQDLSASMRVRQVIDPADARELTKYVTGAGVYGTDRGDQFVRLHVFGPYGGSISEIRIDGVKVAQPEQSTIDGRPVKTLAIELDSLDVVVVTWEMKTGADQTGDGVVQMTPSLVDSTSQTFGSGC